MSQLDTQFPDIAYDPTILPRPKPWLIESLWMRGKVAALLGAEKSGKSRLLTWLIASLISSREPLGLPITTEPPKRILYLAGEELVEDMVPRFRCYLNLLGANPDAMLPITFKECTALGLEQPHRRWELEQKLVEGGYDWVVLEPMARLHAAAENENDAMRPIHNWLRHISNSHGMTVTLVHHTGKLNEYSDRNRIATWARGASDLATLVDSAAFLEEEGRRTGWRKLKLLRAGRFPPVDPMSIIDNGDIHGFARDYDGG